MTKQEIVNELNKMFPAEDKKYPVAFIVDGQVMVTSESYSTEAPYTIVDYWQEGHSESYDDFGVSTELNAWLEKHGLMAEWAHAGGVHIGPV